MILVTGGAGFIGSHLVRLLIERGERVRILERPGARVDHLPLNRIELAWADIRDRCAIDAAVIGCNHVYHLAANPQLWTQRKGNFRQVNYVGTVNVLTAALAAGAKRVLHCSTESILTRAQQTTAIAEDQDVPLAADADDPGLCERPARVLSRCGVESD
jgi:dihydroflavonol-4-reductase